MYSRLLALLVVALVVDCIRAQSTISSCINITQGSFQYYWDVDHLSINMDKSLPACINISASDVTISSGSEVKIFSGAAPGGASPPLGILVTGNRVTFNLNFAISSAVVKVTGSNVTFAGLTITGPSQGTYDSVTVLQATNMTGLKVSSVNANYWAANVDLTGIHIQESSDVSIGTSTIIGAGNNQEGYVYKFDNVQNLVIGAGGGSMIGTRVGGMKITRSANITVAYQATSDNTGDESAVLLSVNSSSYVSVQFSTSTEPIGVTTTSGATFTCGLYVENSSFVNFGGSIQAVSASAGAAYGAYITASGDVTIDKFSFFDISGTSDNNTYGIYADNSERTVVTNSFISTVQTLSSNSSGVYLYQGHGTVENNTINLGTRVGTTTLGIVMDATDNTLIAFANNTIDAGSFITAQVQVIQPLCTNVNTIASTCFPSGHYPCCPMDCIPKPDVTKVCRPNVTFCDLEDHCTTSTAWCEPNNFRPSTTDCQDHICGPSDYCAGTSSVCVPAPPPCQAPFAMGLGYCNESIRDCQCNSEFQYPNCTTRCGDYRCDKAELVNVTQHCLFDCYPWCKNTSTITTNCYPSDGVCCLNNTCTFSPTSQVCNASLGGCDPAEMCTGSSPLCPVNVLSDNYTVCNFSHDSCTPPSRCDGSTVACPPLILSVCNGFCGDGICDATKETCTSCGIDCKCPPPPCPGVPECTANGICIDGACSCNDDFSGPSCSDYTYPSTFSQNNSFATIAGKNVSFQIGISRVFELDPTDTVVDSYSLAGLKFTVTTEKLNSSERVNLTTTLPNRAGLRLTSWFFYQATVLDWANSTIPIANYTLKNLVQATNWPFAQLSNRLVIEYTATVDNGACVETNLQLDNNSNVMYFSYRAGDVSLFIQLVRAINLDDKYLNAQFRVVNNDLQVIVPHFWAYVEVDPNFSVLVDDNRNGYNTLGGQCKTKKKKNSVDPILLIEIILPLAAFCVICAIAVAIIYPRVYTWYQTKKGKEHLGTSLDSVPSYDQESYD